MHPYYENDLGKLYHGACLDILSNIVDKFDLILTDPPYGTTKCKWDVVIPFDAVWKALDKLRYDYTAVILFGVEPFSSLLRCSNIKEYKYDLIYEKSCKTNFLNAKKQPLRNHENISVFYNKQCTYNPVMGVGKPYTRKQGVSSDSVTIDAKVKFGGYLTVNNGERYPGTVIKFNRDVDKYHPTQKPVALLEYLIKTYSNENDLVLDFTCGSGSTGVACINLNRRFTLIEKDEKYCEIAAKRLEEAYNNRYDGLDL